MVICFSSNFTKRENFQTNNLCLMFCNLLFLCFVVVLYFFLCGSFSTGIGGRVLLCDVGHFALGFPLTTQINSLVDSNQGGFPLTSNDKIRCDN